MNELKSTFEKIGTNEELKARSLERLLERSRSAAKGEKTMKGTFRLKKAAAIAAAAAAAVAMTVTAGAVIAGRYHKETIDAYLGSGAADELSAIQESKGKVITTANSVENGYFRITVDAVLSEGDRAVIYATRERLTDDNFSIEDPEKGCGSAMDWVHPDFKMEDGSLLRNSGYTPRCPAEKKGTDDFSVMYEKYELNGIVPGKKLVISYYDPHTFMQLLDGLDSEAKQAVFDRPDYEEYRDSYYRPYYLQGLELTLDVSGNFHSSVFTDTKGRTVSLTPYSLYVTDEKLADSIGSGYYPFEIRFISADGVQTVNCTDTDIDWDAEAQTERGWYFSFGGLVKDPEKVTSIEIDGVETFSKTSA